MLLLMAIQKHIVMLRAVLPSVNETVSMAS